MNQDDLILLGMAAVGALCVVVIAYVLISPYLTGEKRAEQRVQGIAEGARGARGALKNADPTSSRKKQVADTIADLEAKQKADQKVSLRQQIERAGLSVDVKAFYIASAVSGVVIFVLALVLAPGMPIFIPVALGGVGAFGLPRWILARMVKRRQSKFLDEFANSIDIIVRGVKSGLPLNECLSIIARESPDPVSGEFREVVEQQRVGVPLGECFERMMGRMPLPEVRFFGIVIAISQQAGGNLSEALGNLSGVLRDRKRMQAKVKALSAEAKASAGVLASLPFIVMLLVYLSTPDYIALLWQKQYGQFLLLFAGFWMSCGVMVMRKMINFKF